MNDESRQSRGNGRIAVMKILIVVVIAMLAACDSHDTTTITSAGKIDVIMYQVPLLSDAPKGETPLERWKRTKADYEAASKIEDTVLDAAWQISMPAFRAYEDAGHDLQALNCGNVCAPPTSH